MANDDFMGVSLKSWAERTLLELQNSSWEECFERLERDSKDALAKIFFQILRSDHVILF